MKRISALLSSAFFLLSIVLPSYAQESIIIGLDADMSAVAKEGGLAIQRGAEIAINEINAQGGLLGKQLKLVVKDHKGNPARGIANLKSFSKMDNLAAVLGGVHTPVALQELPFIHSNRIIYLDPWAAGTPIVDNKFEPNYVFRVSIRDEQAGKVILSHAKKRNLKKVGLLLERTGWGRSNEKSMSQAAKENDINIASIAWFNWGQKSLTKEITQLINEGSQAILLVANAPEGAIAAQEMLTIDKAKRVPIISHWGIAGGNFVKKVGLEQLNQLDISTIQTYSFAQPTNNKINENVLSAYRKQYDEKVMAKGIPGAVGTAHAYDLVHLLAIAIKKSNNLDSVVIRDNLEKIKSYSGLVKHYKPPFTKTKHDALWAEDYILSRFDSQGHLVPITE